MPFITFLQSIAWPLLILWISERFRPEIKSFFAQFTNRSLRFKALGIEAEIVKAEQAQDVALPVNDKIVQTELLGPNNHEASKLIETGLKAEVEKIDINKREAALIRELANTRLTRSHEFLYNRIFGSQIQALKTLNERGSASLDDALEFWKVYAAQFPAMYNTYSFEQWMSFLLKSNLVERNENRLTLTVFGKDFLFYLIATSLTERKPW